MQPLYAIINSGFNVSGDVDLRKRTLVGIQVPIVGASGDLALQGNMDQTSGNFVRYLDTRAAGTADLRFSTGAGSRYLSMPDRLETLPFLRLEVIGAAGSLQSDTRTFTLLTRPR